MKKIILLIIALSVAKLSAQSERQGIELPDFVITGKQSISLPVAVKKKPDFVSTLSKDFFTPQYSPEELPLLISSEPIPEKPGIKTFDNYFSGLLKVQAGRYSLPVGEFNWNQSFDNYLFGIKAWGSNIKEYVPNAGYNNSGVSMTHDFFLSTKSDFLPGTEIKLAANYLRDSYKLFGSANPQFLRETNGGSALFSAASSYNRWINFSFNLGGNILSISENGLKETNIFASGLFEFKFNQVTVGAKGNYSKQMLDKNISGIGDYNFASGDGYAKVFLLNDLWFTLGLSYAAGSGNSFFAPFGSLDFRLDKFFTFGVEFKPHVQLVTTKDFLKNNLYYNFGLIDNVFEEVESDLKGQIKYEYDKYFTLSASAEYSKTKNYFYFDDVKTSGIFDLFISPKVNSFSIKLDALYHPSIYGYFYGEINLQDVRDQSEKVIPYQPKISSAVTYGYDFNFGLGFKTRYELAFDIYTDMLNSNKLPDYHDVSFSLYYEILSGLKFTAEFQNILNRSNFVWRQYQAKQFDVLLGIEYRW